MKATINFIKRNSEFLLIFCGTILFVFGILSVTDALSNGFNLIDDKDLFRLENRLNSVSFWEACRLEIEHDLFYPRVRLLYYPLRLFMTGLLGTNFLYWSVYKALEIVGAMIALYFFARNFSSGRIYSILFSMLCLCGAQSAIWWRLGCQESTGIFLLGVTLWLISTKNSSIKKHRILYNLTLGVFILGVATIKESFLLYLPVLVGVMVFAELRENTQILLKDILNAIKKHKFYIIYMAIIFFSQGFFIIYLLYKRQGISENGGIKQLLLNFYFMMLSGQLEIYFAFGIMFLFLILMKMDDLKKDNTIIFWLSGGMLSFIYITITQFFMYKESGISERYLLPWLVGFGLFYCVIAGRVLKKYRWQKIIYGISLSLLVIIQIELTYESIQIAADDEKAVNRCLNEVLLKSSEDSDILAIMSSNEGEWNNAAVGWLIENNRQNVYLLNYDSEKSYSKQTDQIKGTKNYDYSMIDVIVTVEDGTIEKYLEKNGIEVSGFSKSVYSGYYDYIVYYKNKSI